MIITIPDPLAGRALATMDGPDPAAKATALEQLVLDFLADHILAAGVAALDARWRADREAVDAEVDNLRPGRKKKMGKVTRGVA